MAVAMTSRMVWAKHGGSYWELVWMLFAPPEGSGRTVCTGFSFPFGDKPVLQLVGICLLVMVNGNQTT